MRWLFFSIGLIIMSFGVALMIEADLGSAPWDVLHIGLYLQFGLTVGTWSIIVGLFILAVSSLMLKMWPQAGAVLNMLLVGVFIDIFLLVLSTPESLLLRSFMLVSGIVIMGYGIGLYIAPNCGAGPRDSLMLALHELTGWAVSRVRGVMEIFVLLIGWLLGGPVFIGTILFSVGIGAVVGRALPQCRVFVQQILERGVRYEDFHEGPLRSDDHDRTCKEAR
nr:YitT family protein [Salsuginibacillus halophilus]